MSFLNFTNEQKHSWSGTFSEIKPNELLIYKDKFDDPNLPGEMTVTVSFKEVSCGTELGNFVCILYRLLLAGFIANASLPIL
jgi:uncharacterized protein YndB with AHSA1/START domain